MARGSWLREGAWLGGYGQGQIVLGRGTAEANSEIVYMLSLHRNAAKPHHPRGNNRELKLQVRVQLRFRYNDRTCQDGQRKPELAAAVCDSMVNGTPPRCPKCKNSILRFRGVREIKQSTFLAVLNISSVSSLNSSIWLESRSLAGLIFRFSKQQAF